MSAIILPATTDEFILKAHEILKRWDKENSVLQSLLQKPPACALGRAPLPLPDARHSTQGIKADSPARAQATKRPNKRRAPAADEREDQQQALLSGVDKEFLAKERRWEKAGRAAQYHPENWLARPPTDPETIDAMRVQKIPVTKGTKGRRQTGGDDDDDEPQYELVANPVPCPGTAYDVRRAKKLANWVKKHPYAGNYTPAPVPSWATQDPPADGKCPVCRQYDCDDMPRRRSTDRGGQADEADGQDLPKPAKRIRLDL